MPRVIDEEFQGMRKMSALRKTVLGLTFLALAGVLTLPLSEGFAQDKAVIGQAKAEGLVGETASGYLAVRVDTVPETLRRDVSAVNLKRKATYADFARQKGVTEQVAAALFAEQLIADAKLGEWVRDGNGNWIEIK